MGRTILVPGKHSMSALMLALKKTIIKLGSIPVHMHNKQTSTKQSKDKDEIPTGTVYAGKANKTTTPPLPT